MFGEIVGGEMLLNEAGSIAVEVWTALPLHYRHIELDAFVIMPNHVHGLIVFCDSRDGMRYGLSEIVRGFKSFSARRINEARCNSGCPVWQRNYYDRVIRSESELARARTYIVNNPLKWDHDKENPVHAL